MERRMDLLVDFAFKRLFGQPQSSDLLIDFLNAVLQRPVNRRIVEVQFANTEFASKDSTDKSIRLDVLVRTDQNEWVDVEVQVAPQKAIVKRTLLYWARMYDEQVQRGQDYAILKPAIVIQILDFVHITSTERFHTSYHVVEDQDGFRLPDMDILELHFIEMTKFHRLMENGHTINQALHDPLQKWLLFLLAQRDATFRKELEATRVSDSTMEKAFNLWEEISKDPENWAVYVNRDMAIRDLNQIKREGREEGKAEGKQEERVTIASNLLKMGLSLQDVANATGLSKEQIEDVQQRLDVTK